jgi:hypothetical protein
MLKSPIRNFCYIGLANRCGCMQPTTNVVLMWFVVLTAVLCGLAQIRRARDRRELLLRPAPTRPRPPCCAVSPSSARARDRHALPCSRSSGYARPHGDILADDDWELAATHRGWDWSWRRRPLWPLQRHVLCSRHDAVSSIRLGHRREREDV